MLGWVIWETANERRKCLESKPSCLPWRGSPGQPRRGSRRKFDAHTAQAGRPHTLQYIRRLSPAPWWSASSTGGPSSLFIGRKSCSKQVARQNTRCQRTLLERLPEPIGISVGCEQWLVTEIITNWPYKKIHKMRKLTDWNLVGLNIPNNWPSFLPFTIGHNCGQLCFFHPPPGCCCKP